MGAPFSLFPFAVFSPSTPLFECKIGKSGSLRARGGTLGISGWRCAAGTLEPLTYTRASSAEFFYPILK